jgi:hypothetical protein
LLPDRTPTVLEKAIAAAAAQEIGQETLLWTLAASTLFVPSASEVTSTFEEVQPVLYDYDGNQMLAVVTDPGVTGDFAKGAPYLVSMRGDELVSLLPEGSGLMVNPGHSNGFALPPSAVAALRRAVA